MAAKYAKHMSVKMTPPTEKVRGKDQVINSAGGAVFKVGDFERLNRFLVLGSDKNFYSSEAKLTKENAECVLRCLTVDPKKTIDTIIEISDSGRAPKNDPAIFALALCAGFGDESARALAYLAMPSVLRTPTHLFAFVESVKEFRGFGSGLRKAIERWYNLKSDGDLAFHLVKFQSRNGWSHRDVFRLVHPVADTPAKQAIYRWAVCGASGLGSREVLRKVPNKPDHTASYPALDGLPRIIQAFEEAKTADEQTIVKLIREDRLPRECIPTQHLNSVAVWEALLESSMPLTAMIRNLGKMTSVGLLKPLSNAAKTVASRLGDQDYIKKSRVHPIAILMALKVYGQGHGDKGKLNWEPVATVKDALDAAFYLSFGNVDPANKRTLMGVDVSSSMDGGQIAGTSLTPREAAAAIAMVTVKTEPDYAIMGFSNRLVPIDLTKATSLGQVISIMQRIPMGGTDCSLPIKYAEHGKLEVDTFITLTDCETWASANPFSPTGSNEWAWGSRFGTGQCFQWLKKYRDTMGIQARNIVAAFTATNFTIADPSDPLSLDCVGLDSNTPALISDFSAGRI